MPVSEANAPPWIERRDTEDAGGPRLLDRLLARELRVLLVLLHLVLALGAIRVLLAHLAFVERHGRAGTARLVLAVVRLVLGRRAAADRPATRCWCASRCPRATRGRCSRSSPRRDLRAAAADDREGRRGAAEVHQDAGLEHANSGAAWRRGCGTDDTRNVVLPARTRIFAFGGIGEIVVRPCAASSASDVDWPPTIISPSMPWREVEHEVVAVRRDQREVRRRRALDRELDARRGADADARALLLLAHARERRRHRARSRRAGRRTRSSRSRPTACAGEPSSPASCRTWVS